MYVSMYVVTLVSCLVGVRNVALHEPTVSPKSGDLESRANLRSNTSPEKKK